MPDPNSSTQDGPKAARKTDEPATATPATTPAPADTSDVGVYEPYPGAEFFHGGRHSPINAALGRRLEQEGHGDGRLLGPDWTNAHRDAVARFQQTLRPKGGGDTSGIPDETAWDRLKVPRVSPRTPDA
ncbi:hypothetical protein SUDANB145_07333 (plasmid) [Streptomyces sp. enrichment culture]|uniref:peptidoglycan-binding protein n=1 Tax=Streptomyces sp. enrichment culture TaxID=1795815 RepID=UPI003F54F614